LKQYYDARAPEYDDWYLGQGLFERRERPEWEAAVRALELALAGLPPARTLDVACGTGFLTCHLPGEITALDQSQRMLDVARARVPEATLVEGDALELPFEDSSFERVFTGHFYGHLEQHERLAFLAEARRVAPELVVVDSAVRPDHEHEEWQTRVLNDGSSFSVFKRYFEASRLAEELGAGRILHQSPWFVMVASSRGPGRAQSHREH
jgi:demethylmenaquinone methyltransferase/2-methoxy-6-polyprenyl-1,4-benzoquinol methylase